jgi:hypothetical protein
VKKLAGLLRRLANRFDPPFGWVDPCIYRKDDNIDGTGRRFSTCSLGTALFVRSPVNSDRVECPCGVVSITSGRRYEGLRIGR